MGFPHTRHQVFTDNRVGEFTYKPRSMASGDFCITVLTFAGDFQILAAVEAITPNEKKGKQMKATVTESEIKIEMNFDDAKKNALLIVADASRTEASFTVNLSKIWGSNDELEVFFQKTAQGIEAVAFIDEPKFICYEVLTKMECEAYSWMYTRIAELKRLKASIALANSLND